MDLNFYSDLTDGTGQPGDPEFLDAQAFNGFDTVQKVITLQSLTQTPLSVKVTRSLSGAAELSVPQDFHRWAAVEPG